MITALRFSDNDLTVDTMHEQGIGNTYQTIAVKKLFVLTAR